MKNINWKFFLKHFSAILVFVLISVIYFSPILEGKKIFQSDSVQFSGMSKEISDHREQYNEDPLWTNSMFGGMPAYQISVQSEFNLVKKFYRLFQLYLPHPINLLFLYMLGFYFLIISLRIDYRLAIIGAISFGFSSTLSSSSAGSASSVTSTKRALTTPQRCISSPTSRSGRGSS